MSSNQFPYQNYSPAQQAAVKDLIAWLDQVYPQVNLAPSMDWSNAMYKAGQRQVVNHLKSLLEEE